MSRHPHCFFRTWIVTALVAVVAWLWLPGSQWDRTFCQMAAHQVADPPIGFSGKGTHLEPWRMQTQQAHDHDLLQWDLVVLGDPVDATFQGSPHAPIDFALIFSNLQRLGARQLACAALLAWEAPDPFGLTAMENTLADFESVVIAAPLTRGTVMEALPPPFRRNSLLLEDLVGNSSLLPVVNRVSIPTMIYGGDNTLAGFQVIDSEPRDGTLPLLARWDYRVVLAFPLATLMQRLGVTAADLHVEVGSHIQLGRGGLRIPIDEHGRFHAPGPRDPFPETKAEELIDAEHQTLAHPLLLDRRSRTEPSTRDFNQSLSASLQGLLTADAQLRTRTLTRWSGGVEIPGLLLLALMASSSVMIGRVLHTLIVLMAMVLCAAITIYGVSAGFWLPCLPAAATLLAAWTCCLLWGRKRRRTTPMPRLDRLTFRPGEDPA